MISFRHLLLCLLALLPASAWAQTWLDSDRFTFSGFGTVGLIHSNLEEADFVRDISQPKGAGKGLSARTDSLLGAQLGVRLEDNLDAVVQGVSRYHDSGNFSPELSWAFARWSPDPGVQLRAGRLGWDVYLLSDSRYVGYAYPWVRPPVDHFGVLQLTHIDGADFTFKRSLGDGLAWFKLFTGRSDSHLYLMDDLEVEIKVNQLYGGHLNYETGPWHFRLGYTTFDADVDFSGAYPAMLRRIYGVDANALIGDMFGFNHVEVYSVGATYDQGPIELQGIWNRNKLTGEGGYIDSGFISTGYRLGKAMPFVMFSRVDTYSPDDEVGTNFTQQTWSAGLRYDVATNLALKSQIDRIHILDPGPLWRDIDADWNGGWATMVSLGLDFVF